MHSIDTTRGQVFAREFVSALTKGNVADAHEMLSDCLKRKISGAKLKDSYKEMTAYGPGSASISEPIIELSH